MLLFPHICGAQPGGSKAQVARSSCQPLDQVRSRVVLVSSAVIVFAIL
jgi:hypothetical protein